MKNPHSTGLLSSFWNHAILPRTVLRVLSVQLCFVRDSTSIPAGAPALGSLQQQLQQERTSILFSVDGEDLSPAVLGGAEENSRGRRPGDTESVSPAGRRVLALEYGGLRGTRRGDGRKKFAEVGGPDVAVHVRGSGAAHHDDNNKGLVAAAIASSSAVEREKAPPKSSIRHAFGLACLNFGMLCFLLSWTPQLIFNVLDTRQLPTLSLLTQCFILGMTTTDAEFSARSVVRRSQHHVLYKLSEEKMLSLFTVTGLVVRRRRHTFRRRDCPA